MKKKKKTFKLKEEDKQELVALRRSGMTLRAIAALKNIDHKLVHYYAKRAGLVKEKETHSLPDVDLGEKYAHLLYEPVNTGRSYKEYAGVS